MARERPRKVINVLISEREEWFIQAVSEALHQAVKEKGDGGGVYPQDEQ